MSPSGRWGGNHIENGESRILVADDIASTEAELKTLKAQHGEAVKQLAPMRKALAKAAVATAAPPKPVISKPAPARTPRLTK